MSKANPRVDKREGDQPEEEGHALEHALLTSDGPEGPNYKERVALLPIAKLLQLLSKIAPDDLEESGKPLSADEFRSVLARVESLGWTWTTDDPPALTPKSNVREEPEFPKELAEKYPHFPGELASVIKSMLLGWRPRGQLGSSDDLAAKEAAVSELILTKEYCSAFFFDHSTKGRRFHDLDWEVTIKAAERNVRFPPSSVYAILSLETIEKQPRFEEQLEVSTFAADERSLRRMIDILQDVLKAVQETRKSAHGRKGLVRRRGT